jgi:trk system potassium uptake protein TrkA
MAREKVFAVFGLGAFGYKVCEVLSEKGAKVIAVDHNENLIEKVKNMVTQAVLIDSTDEEALKSAPIEDIDVAIVGMGDNLEASILTTALLKNQGVPYIIARAISDIHSQVLKQVGATEVINIEIEEGKRVASRLASPNIIDKVSIGKNQVLAEIVVSKNLIGKTLKELDLRKKYNINVISIKRVETSVDEMGNPIQNEISEFPTPLSTLQRGDTLVVVGMESDIEKIKEI